MADHLERRRPRPDDDARLQDHGLDAGLQQDLTDGRARSQMRRQSPTSLGCSPPRYTSRLTPARCAAATTLRADCASWSTKSGPRAHRVHEVVDDVDAVECRGQRVGVAEVSANDLGPLAPRHVGEFVRVARQRAYVIAAVKEFGYQPAADVAGRARDQTADFVIRHARGWPFMRFGKPKRTTRLSSRAATG